MADEIQGHRIQGTQTYVSFSQIVEDFFNGDSVFDLAELYGEPEVAIEDLIRKNMQIKNPTD